MVHAVAVQDTIIPNEREAEIFKILTSTLSHGSLSSVLRCAGGWVRDKLLGLESDDIDIAVDNMLGREFADHVNSFLQSQKLDTRKVSLSVKSAGFHECPRTCGTVLRPALIRQRVYFSGFKRFTAYIAYRDDKQGVETFLPGARCIGKLLSPFWSPHNQALHVRLGTWPSSQSCSRKFVWLAGVLSVLHSGYVALRDGALF